MYVLSSNTFYIIFWTSFRKLKYVHFFSNDQHIGDFIDSVQLLVEIQQRTVWGCDLWRGVEYSRCCIIWSRMYQETSPAQKQSPQAGASGPDSRSILQDCALTESCRHRSSTSLLARQTFCRRSSWCFAVSAKRLRWGRTHGRELLDTLSVGQNGGDWVRQCYR